MEQRSQCSELSIGLRLPAQVSISVDNTGRFQNYVGGIFNCSADNSAQPVRGAAMIPTRNTAVNPSARERLRPECGPPCPFGGLISFSATAMPL